MKNLGDLYEHILSEESIDSLLDNEKNSASDRGKHQEGLLKLFAFLNVLDEFKDYEMCIGNYNLGSIRKPEGDEFLTLPLCSKGDSSDLTGINPTDGTILVTTCKYLRDYNIGDLEIEKIEFNKAENNLQICVCVPSKEYLKQKIESAERTSHKTIEILRNAIIIDHTSLRIAFGKFKSIYLNHHFLSDKKPLLLKYHQDISVRKTLKLFDEGVSNVLWGHLPRSGKSYIIAGLIDKFTYDTPLIPRNYLLITTAPNETISQYVSMFESLLQFADYKIVDFRSEPSIKTRKPRDLKDLNIFIASKQYLQTNRDITWMKKINFDIRFVDESHMGGTTELTKNILDIYRSQYTVYITATFMKPAISYEIPRDYWILWTLEDIKQCKYMESQEQLEKFTAEQFGIELGNFTYDTLGYEDFPDLYVLTERIAKSAANTLIGKTIDNSYGYSLTSLFLIDEESGEFQNKGRVEEFCQRIFGKDTLEIDSSYMQRIERVLRDHGDGERFQTIMCFLPTNGINAISEALKELLENSGLVDDYEIVIINTRTGRNPKEIIDEGRIIAKNRDKRGLIVLSGRQCSLGVTIPDCTTVILMNNTEKFDTIFQMMFRCMCEGKPYGFVIDMNTKRAIRIITEYSSLCTSISHPKQAINHILREKLIRLNSDHLETAEYSEEFIERLYEIYISDTEDAMETILSKIKYKKCSLNREERQFFAELVRQNKGVNEYFNELKDGIEKENGAPEEENGESSSAPIEEKDKTLKKTIEKYMKILCHVMPLACILTINLEIYDLAEIFNAIAEDEDKLRIFTAQLNIYWEKDINEKTAYCMLKIFVKIIDEEINMVGCVIKEMFIRSKKIGNLGTLIDKYIIPTKQEKKNNAEISTPAALRREMLDTVPAEFWESPQTVFEPCCGKGGFVVDVIARFMASRPANVDEEDYYMELVGRYIYFADINPVNIYITRLLIDPEEKYHLNYYEGNTLEMDPEEEWGIEGFDLIVGGPPYQAPRRKENKTKGGGGDLLWNKFVIYSIRLLATDGYLLYINPSGWRKPPGLNVLDRSKYRGMYDLMTKENQLLYLNINDTAEGLRVSKCGTRFDFYLLKKCTPTEKTVIIDEDNCTSEIFLPEVPFIPNGDIDIILNVMSNCPTNNIEVLRPGGDPRRDYISEKESEIYKYKMIHSTPSSGVRYKYCSKRKQSDHFGIKKIIFGETGVKNAIFDLEGKFGCTCCSIGIEVSEDTYENYYTAIMSKKFARFLNKCSWSNYRIDWRLFTYLRKDFWKEFI